MNKTERQELIMDLLEQEYVSDQQQLINLLRKRGELVTQTTLSRDLTALHVVKTSMPDGTYRYQVPDPTLASTATPQPRLPKGVIQLVDYSGNMVVLHTAEGYAQLVAQELEQRSGSIVLGTIAGLDTVFAVVAEGQSRDTVRYLLHEIFG